jgi:hypothetical protein
MIYNYQFYGTFQVNPVDCPCTVDWTANSADPDDEFQIHSFRLNAVHPKHEQYVNAYMRFCHENEDERKAMRKALEPDARAELIEQNALRGIEA